jgi:hypothetical protein
MCSVRPHCDLFGHVNKKNCKHKHCVNVQVDWLTILLSVSASHTITELLKARDCTVDPNTLRSGGKFGKFADWEHVKQTCDSIGAEQLLEQRAYKRFPEESHSLIQEPVTLPIERRDYHTTLDT